MSRSDARARDGDAPIPDRSRWLRAHRRERSRWARTAACAIACAVVGALPSRALEGAHCVTNHGELAPCMTGGGSACCDAVSAWEANGCFCDGVVTSLDATQTAGAVSFANACSIVRTTDASDALCARATANQQQGGSSPPSGASPPSGDASSTDGPDAPTNVYALRTGANEVVVGWTASASSDVVAYAIDACDASDLATCASPTRTNVLSGTSYVFTGVMNPSTMVYRVKAATSTMASDSSSPTTVPILDARDALLVSASSSASSASTCGAWATPCDSVSSALAATSTSATRTVLLLPGTHTTSCGSTLGSSGAVSIASATGAASTVLDCGETSRGFEITGSDDVTISGITIKRGLAFTGGGIKMTNAGSVTIDGVDVVECKSQTMGGGVHSINSSPVIRDSRFISNSGGNDRSGNNNRGGGAYLQTSSHATLRNVSFIGNTLDDSGKGAGLNVDENSNVTAVGLTLKDNRAFFAAGLFVGHGCHGTFSNVVASGNEASYGAAIGVFVGGKPTFDTGLVSDNRALLWGAGVIVYTNAHADFNGFSFEENQAEIGGGIFMYSQSSASVSNSRVVSNVASKHGAGVRMDGRSRLVLINTRVSNNVASLTGGGAHVSTGAILTLNGGEISENTAANGAGLACDGGEHGGAEIFGSGVGVRANVASGLGGGAYLTKACAATFTDTSVIDGNRAVSGSSCRALYAVGGGAFALEPNTPAAPTTLVIAGTTTVRNNTAPSGGAVFVVPAPIDAATNSPRGAQITATSSAINGNAAVGCESTITGRGGALFIAAGNHTFTQATIKENTASDDGGAAYISGVGALTMNACAIKSNAASRFGGAVAHVGSKLKVMGGVIESNAAIDGGGVYVASTETSTPQFALLGATLRANSATRGGATYFATNLGAGLLRQVTHDENTAMAGADSYWLRSMSSNVEFSCVECAFAHADGSTTGVIATEALAMTSSASLTERVQSGKVADDFSVQLVDYYDNAATSEFTTTTCEIDPVSTSTSHARHELEISGSTSSTTSRGVATFSGSILRGELDKTYTVRVTCERDTTLPLVDIAPLDLPVRISACFPGSEPLVTTYADGVDVARECTVCKDRTFNFDGIKCLTCPRGGNCRGGSSLDALPGWWRSSDTAEVLFSCPVTESCVAGNVTGKNACEVGYEGPVCALCAEGYRHWGGKCSKCGSSASLAMPAIGIIAFFAFLVYIFRKPLKQVVGTVIFSATLFVAQILGLLKEYDINWPQSIGRLVEVLDITNFNTESLTPGCSGSKSNYYSTYIAAVVVPPAVTAFCLLTYALTGVIERHATHERVRSIARCMRKKCRRNATWLVVLSYSGVAKTVLQLYNQRRLDVGVYLRRDYSINASNHEHTVYRITGIIALLMYPIGIPVAITYILVRNRKRLDDPAVQANFGFLFSNVRDEFPYWELTGLVLKFLLAAIPVFANERTLRMKKTSYDTSSDFNGITQLSLAQLFIGVLLVAIIALKPYKKSLHNAQYSIAIGIIFAFVTISANVLNADDAYSEGEKTGVAGVAVSLACGALIGAAAKSYHIGEFKSRKSTDDDDEDEVSDSALDADLALEKTKKISLGV